MAQDTANGVFTPCPVVVAAARLDMVSTALPYQCPRPLVLVLPIGGMFLSASLG
jgi:hypothetical protein